MKLITCILILAVAPVVDAALMISVDDVADPCGTGICVETGKTVSLSIIGDGMSASRRIIGVWLLVEGHGAIEGGPVILHVPSFRYYDCEMLPYFFPWMLDGTCEEALSNFSSDDLAYISLDWGGVTPVEATLVRNITFTCLAEGDVTLRLVDAFFDYGAPYDTVVIHQVPHLPVVYHVDTAAGDNGNDGLSRETAFATIQKGIDSARDGDTVLVWPGLYSEAVNFTGKAITVSSAADAAFIEAPGRDAVTFHTAEGPDSILKNFVIRNSAMAVSLNYESSPTISNLTIANNNFGIAAYENSDPDISNCIFADNIDGDLFGCTARYSYIDPGPGDEPAGGLVSHWKFDEAAGSVAYDSAGANHGTIYGAQWTTGLFDGALTFDGVADHVEVPDDDSLDVSTEVTLAAWVQLAESQDRYVRIVGKGGEYDYQGPYTLTLDDSGRYLGASIGDGHDWNYHEYAGQALEPNQWCHVAMTYSTVQNVIKLYLNGDEVLSETETASLIDTPTPLGIGALKYRGSWVTLFNGSIDDVRLYDRALSAGEIRQLYQNISQDPVAHWKFDEAGGSVAYDSAGDNHGTIYGARWTTGLFDGALDFDGSADYIEVSDDDSLDVASEVTAAAWIKVTGTPERHARILGKGGDYDYQAPFTLMLDDNGRYLGATIGDGHDWNYHKCAGQALDPNQWCHVAMTYSTLRNVIKLYLNGDEVLSETETAPLINTPSPLGIGALKYRGSWVTLFTGSIDDVIIFDRALSAGEIDELYQGGPPIVDPLFADPSGGDYHLKSGHGRYWPEHDIWVLDKATSPCIDAGDPAADFSAELQPNGGRVNAGAYGGTAFASRSRPLTGDVNNDGIVNMLDFALLAKNWLESMPLPPVGP